MLLHQRSKIFKRKKIQCTSMEKRGVKKKFTNDRPTCRYKNLFQRRDTEMMMFKSLFALIYDVYSTTVYGNYCVCASRKSDYTSSLYQNFLVQPHYGRFLVIKKYKSMLPQIIAPKMLKVTETRHYKSELDRLVAYQSSHCLKLLQ